MLETSIEKEIVTFERQREPMWRVEGEERKGGEEILREFDEIEVFLQRILFC